MMKINRYKNQITMTSLLLIVVGFAAGFIGRTDVKDMVLLLATIIASVPIFMKAYQALRMKTFSIDLLVSIAVAGALYLQEYSESSLVTFLFLFGDYLEARTLEKTRSSIRELLDMAPKKATVIRAGIKTTVPVEEVKRGDLVVILSGGKVPVDGRVVEGQAFVNEATVTGESVPTRKKAGSKVFSGTILDNGYLEMEAEKVGEDTTFAKIISLVEEAQESKTKTGRFLDWFANIYTPIVVILAIVVYVITRDLNISITFLVIACPGALVIGAPVSTVAGIGNGARHGVLIKGGETVDVLSKVNAFIFDKTGTLTRGKPEVIDIKTFNHVEANELLQTVALAEAISEHHLGQTIVREAQVRDLKTTGKVESGEVVKGQGIRAKVNGRLVTIGNRKLMDKYSIMIQAEVNDYAVDQEMAGSTVVFAAIDGKIGGLISIADNIREEVVQALTDLRANGVKKMVMLTGDNPHTAELVARKLGLDEYYAELLPEDKVEYVAKLKQEGYVVAIVGDGINDAPAIAKADVGIAMGKGGTDVSMETADVVLLADKFTQLSHAYLLSTAINRNIKQNTYFAILTVILLLVGVLMESVHLASGMFIHEASVLLVILNAMRLLGFTQKRPAARGNLQNVHV